MTLEAAAQSQFHADVEPGQAADHGDAPAEDLVAALEHRDCIAALLVDEEELVQRSLDQEFNLLARFRHLPHPVGGRDALRLRQEELLAVPSASSERARGYQELLAQWCAWGGFARLFHERITGGSPRRTYR